MARPKKSLKDSIESETVNAAPKSSAPIGSQVEKIKIKPKNFIMDLRIHSPASLGYMGIEGIDTAPALVRLAQVKGLDVIAITDYYSGAFVDRILEAARDTSLFVIPGVVIRCAIPGCDDVNLSCLFPQEYGTGRLEEFLGKLGIPRESFGDRGYIVRLELSKIIELVESSNGVALPSRMDKTPSRLSAIPILVEKFGFRAFDLAYADSVKFFKQRWPKMKFHLFSFSNANALAQVGNRIAKVKMPEASFDGVRDLIARQSPLGA